MLRQRGGVRFFHYSSAPITSLHDIPANQVGKLFLKPDGLWLSEEDAWKAWCESSEYAACTHTYEATLDPSKLYRIDYVKSLMNFQKTYGRKTGIDWGKVAKSWAGIQFTNYDAVAKALSYDYNPDLTWFFAVDIDSVCVWRPSEAILSFVEV